MIDILKFQFTYADIFTVIIGHFIADFILQTNWQATNKSWNMRALTSHIINYALGISFIFFLMFPWITFMKTFIFMIITFVCHYVQDFITSRIGHRFKLYGQKTNEWRPFFWNIGIDQILHYIQIFTTLLILK